MQHTTVLLKEAIDGLNIKVGDVFVDGTLGGGGHMEEVCKRFGSTVVMIGIDLDPEAIERAARRLDTFKCPISYTQGSFRNIETLTHSLGVNQVNEILLDIGLSSNQFEDSGRGFSFQKDEPLIMSFKNPPAPDTEGRAGDITENYLTARKIVNDWDEENIRAILEGYGEEQFAYKIAKAIVVSREIKPIKTTFYLV